MKRFAFRLTYIILGKVYDVTDFLDGEFRLELAQT